MNEAGNNSVTIIKNISFTREGYKNHHYIGVIELTSNLKNKTIMKTPTGNTMPSKYNGVFFRKEGGGVEEGSNTAYHKLSVQSTTHHLKNCKDSHVSFMQITRKQQHPDSIIL